MPFLCIKFEGNVVQNPRGLQDKEETLSGCLSTEYEEKSSTDDRVPRQDPVTQELPELPADSRIPPSPKPKTPLTPPILFVLKSENPNHVKHYQPTLTRQEGNRIRK